MQPLHREMTSDRNSDSGEAVGFFLGPKFPMLAFSAAIEPLLIANWLSGRTLYSWRVFTETGAQVQASNGLLMTPDAAMSSVDRFPMMLVCLGVEGCYYKNKKVFGWLRKLARNGTLIGGIGTGPYALARAGLLDDYRCTIHWEELDTFSREFPHLNVNSALFEIDRGRMTCPGGTAAMDMMLSIIGQRHGGSFAGEIAEQLLQHRIRDSHDPQRTTLQSRMRVNDPRLLAAIEAMEQNLEEPLSLEQICMTSGLSLRHLQRRFVEELRRSPTEFYRDLRLRRARQMLLHGSRSILDVAVATGFMSSSHFARRYRSLFGHTPREERHR